MQVGMDILPIASEEVFTSTLQSKSTSLGKDTEMVNAFRNKLVHGQNGGGRGRGVRRGREGGLQHFPYFYIQTE